MIGKISMLLSRNDMKEKDHAVVALNILGTGKFCFPRKTCVNPSSSCSSKAILRISQSLVLSTSVFLLLTISTENFFHIDVSGSLLFRFFFSKY